MASFTHLFGASSHRIAEADSVAVIGLGRFGSSLAVELMDAGTEGLGIDNLRFEFHELMGARPLPDRARRG